MKHARVLVFRGPEHHGQLLRPVEDALEKRGAQIIRWTTDTEGCFQIGLEREVGEEYAWLPDWWDREKAKQAYIGHADWLKHAFLEPNELSTMLPQVLDRVVRSTVHEWYGVEALFKKFRPTHCLALHEINRWGAIMGAQASHRKIPYATLQEGLYYNKPYVYQNHTKYSHSYIWGEATKQLLLQAGCAEERLHVVGHPDLRARWEHGAQDRTLLDQALPPEAIGKKLVFIFCGHISVADITDVARLWRGVEGSGYFFVARHHQLASLPDIEKLRVIFNHPGASCLLENSLPIQVHWQAMAAASVCVIIGCSTTTVEWAWAKKPLGLIHAPGMLKDYAAEGIGVACDGMPFAEAAQQVAQRWERECGDRAAEFLAREIVNGDAAEVIAEGLLHQEPMARSHP